MDILTWGTQTREYVPTGVAEKVKKEILSDRYDAKDRVHLSLSQIGKRIQQVYLSLLQVAIKRENTPIVSTFCEKRIMRLQALL